MEKDTLIQNLVKRVEQLEQKRSSQRDITPDAVKMRHVAEGVRFVRDGATADKPTEGEEPLQGAAMFFDTTTNILYIWNRVANAWKSVTLS